MSDFATSRLIDAAATLDPADRALLNIWVNRGLDDAAVARMTGISVETLASRRARIVERLSAVLGLPPADVDSALTQIVPTPEVGPAGAADAPAVNGVAPPSGHGSARPATNGGAPLELVTPAEDIPDSDVKGTAAVEEPETGSASRRRRWMWIALALVLVTVVAVVLVASLASSGSGHHHDPAAVSSQTVPSTSSISSNPSPSPNPSPTVTHPKGDPLVPLPGGLKHTTGTVLVARKGSHLKLKLRVSNLPRLSHGHYEAWLYNSIVNSEPLGRLRAGTRHRSFRLPHNARRYHWIDISVQPAGDVFESGDSVLRSTNPLFRSAAATR